jgi:hypothetical protein
VHLKREKEKCGINAADYRPQGDKPFMWHNTHKEADLA